MRLCNCGLGPDSGLIPALRPCQHCPPQALTGVSSSPLGVEMGEQSLLSLMPLPRSKSQIFTGDTWVGLERARSWVLGPGPKGRPPPSVPLTCWGAHRGCFPGFRSLWAMPAGRTKNQGQVGGHAFQGSWAGGLVQVPPTFVVQEVQGTGYVLHHHAGLQLIKVPPLVYVAENGAWARIQVSPPLPTPSTHPTLAGKPRSPGFFESKVLQPELGPPPWTPMVPLMGRPPGSFLSGPEPQAHRDPDTNCARPHVPPPHLLKDQVETVLLLKELNQLEDVPGVVKEGQGKG